MRVRVVGHGLAGACVAWTAIRSGCEAEVWDDPATRALAASRVAGGIVSLVSGRWMTPAADGLEYFEASREFFLGLGREWGQEFWRPYPTRWAFDSEEVLEAFEKRVPSYEKKGIAFRRLESGDFPAPLRAELGGVEFSQSAFVDLPRFLDESERRLRERGAWVDQRWTVEAERAHGEAERARPLAASAGAEAPQGATEATLFCRGRWKGAEEGEVEWGHTQGECAEVRLAELGHATLGVIFKRKFALIPLENVGEFRLSATFENPPGDGAPSARGLAALKAGLERQVGVRCELVNHRAGIRTHARDHRPVVVRGAHGWVLNGLGSKGVLWAPLCAQKVFDTFGLSHA